jgi:hypothetical protein
MARRGQQTARQSRARRILNFSSNPPRGDERSHRKLIPCLIFLRPSVKALRVQESFRWFGPGDPVPLSFIRQARATADFSSLHDIPCGEAWPRETICERKSIIEAAGLRWNVVHAVPVHEDIKTGHGALARLLDNYPSAHSIIDVFPGVKWNLMLGLQRQSSH